MSSRVVVIIVDFDCEEICRSVESALDALDAAPLPGRILVIDNHPDSPTNTRLASVRDPRVEVLASVTNLGFAGGVMYAIEQSERADFLALLNPDAIAEPQWIARALELLEKTDDAWSCAPVIIRPSDGHVASVGVTVDWFGWPADLHEGLLVSDLERFSLQSLGPTGGAAVIRSHHFRQIGGFDPAFFAYLEDADVAWRASQARLRVVVDLKTRIMHDVGSTFGSRRALKERLMARNRWRLIARNATVRQLPTMFIGLLLHLVVALPFALRRGTVRALVNGHVTGALSFRRDRASRNGQARGWIPLARPSPIKQLARKIGR